MTTDSCKAPPTSGGLGLAVDIRTEEPRSAAISHAAQYCQLYFCRFKCLLPRLRSAARQKWVEGCAFCERILDLEGRRESVIMGVVFVDSPAKPNVLMDLEGEVWPFTGIVVATYPLG